MEDNLFTGRILEDDFKVLDEVGAGGYGQVFHGWWGASNRPVAIKIVHPHLLRDAEFGRMARARFEREWEILRGFKCLDTLRVHVHRYGECEHQGMAVPFIVMDWLEGHNLKEALTSASSIDLVRLDPERVCRMMIDCLRVLRQAHAQNIVHRDIKPANLFIHRPGTDYETVRVLDFGIACRIAPETHRNLQHEGDASLTPPSQSVPGTLQYCAPEGFSPTAPVTPARDVYSLGLVIAEMLMGRPVVSNDINAVLAHSLKLLDPNTKTPLIPQSVLDGPLGEVVARATVYEAKERFADGAAMLEAVEAIYGRLRSGIFSSVSVKAVSREERAWRRKKRSLMRHLNDEAVRLELLEELEEIAEELDWWVQLAALYGEVADEATSSREVAWLRIQAGRVQYEHLGQEDEARREYEAAARLAPMGEAVEWLEEHGDVRRLVTLLVDVFRGMKGDQHAQKAVLACRIGGLFEVRLGDVANAEKIYEQALNQDVGCAPAAVALERLLEGREAYVELDRLYARLVSGSEGTAKLGWVEKQARLVQARFSDSERARALWEEVLEVDAGHLGGLEAIAQLHLDAGREEEAFEALGRWGDALETSRARVEVFARLGELAWARHRRFPTGRDTSTSARVLARADSETPTKPAKRLDITPMSHTANDDLEALRSLLYVEAPAAEHWAGLVRLMEGLESEDVLQAALDSACEHLERRRSAWQPVCRWAPGPWVGAALLGENEPRARLLRALDKARMEFVRVPAGSFVMGSPQGEDGRGVNEAQHEVVLTRPFLMQSTPVTQGQWLEVMGGNPSRFKGCGPDGPVESVSWFSAVVFCNRMSVNEGLDPCYLNTSGTVYTLDDLKAGQDPRFEGLECRGYRLPTEAEWEYACRAGTSGAIYEGEWEVLGTYNAPVLDPIAWYGGNSGVGYEGGCDSSGWKERQYNDALSGTHPVGQKRPNMWGLHDMLGNVWEWCWDRYGVYSTAQASNPAGPGTGQLRVIRGGSWNSGARSVRAAGRYLRAPGVRNSYVGFRLARSDP